MKLFLHQSPFVPLICLLIFILEATISSSVLSTISISKTSNTTLICALVPSDIDSRQSFLNCTTFPKGPKLPFSYPNISVSALVAGNDFQCVVRSQNSSATTLSCWRFSGGVTSYKRIYKGRMLNELDSGESHICGRSNRVECWQWRELDSRNIGRNVSRIAVGGDFLCGLNDRKIECFGNDTAITEEKHSGNFSLIAAGTRHACAISVNGDTKCWGETWERSPVGVFASLALGEGRSCALYNDSKAFCWGESNFSLPNNLVDIEFLRIEAQGRSFCGVLKQNYSLLCWGGDNGGSDSSSIVFDHVMPGPCEANCPCGVLSGYGTYCFQGFICEPCERKITGPDPSPIPSSGPSSPPESQNVPRKKPGKKKNVKIIQLVVGCVGTVTLAMVVGFLVFKFCKTRVCRIHDSGRLDEVASMRNEQVGVQRRLSLNKSRLMSGHSGQLEEFELQVLHRVTNNFSEDHKIGYGSFGSVYRATLDDGREVAIKRAELSVSTSYLAGTKRQDKENAFVSELSQLSRVNHKNLVQLFGYCEDGHERILVYEYMPNGTLHDHLHKLEASSTLMSWTARLRVALDAARGIEYLHSYVVPPIIHRDIKSSNILLDTTWIAKVSDFGLSLMGPEDDEAHISLRAAGTIGYVDPEYYRLQQLTTKSDVYSFGVVLLEILSGYKAIHHHHETNTPRNVVDFALPYITNDEIHYLLDPKLPPPTPFEIEAVTDIGYIAADCVSLPWRDRPSMSDIVNTLDKALALCVTPPSVSLSSV